MDADGFPRAQVAGHGEATFGQAVHGGEGGGGPSAFPEGGGEEGLGGGIDGFGTINGQAEAGEVQSGAAGGVLVEAADGAPHGVGGGRHPALVGAHGVDPDGGVFGEEGGGDVAGAAAEAENVEDAPDDAHVVVEGEPGYGDGRGVAIPGDAHDVELPEDAAVGVEDALGFACGAGGVLHVDDGVGANGVGGELVEAGGQVGVGGPLVVGGEDGEAGEQGGVALLVGDEFLLFGGGGEECSRAAVGGDVPESGDAGGERGFGGDGDGDGLGADGDEGPEGEEVVCAGGEDHHNAVAGGDAGSAEVCLRGGDSMEEFCPGPLINVVRSGAGDEAECYVVGGLLGFLPEGGDQGVGRV